MKSLSFRIRETGSLPIETEGWLPEAFFESTLDQVLAHRLMVGNRPASVGELFDVRPVDGEPDRWFLEGDLRAVHHLGAGMRRGHLEIRGSVGRHLGRGMRGGTIEVDGDAGDRLGAAMSGGTIRVGGNAGDGVGAAELGNPIGMTGGLLVVEGNVGDELGRGQRRGLIAVGGDAGEGAGFAMRAGTILIGGSAAGSPGAGMVRGSIILARPPRRPLLPSFRFACRLQPPMIPPLLASLRRVTSCLSMLDPRTSFDLHSGDLLEGGRGEILIAAPGV